MRQLQVLCFNDYVMGATPVYSASTLDDVLGRYSTWVFQVVVTRVGGIAPRITMWLEHSADARLWKEKGGMPAVSSETISASTTNVFVGADVSGVPSLDYVRLKINLEGTGPRAMVSVWACARGKTRLPASIAPGVVTITVVTAETRRVYCMRTDGSRGELVRPWDGLVHANPDFNGGQGIQVTRFSADGRAERLAASGNTERRPRLGSQTGG